MIFAKTRLALLAMAITPALGLGGDFVIEARAPEATPPPHFTDETGYDQIFMNVHAYPYNTDCTGEMYEWRLTDLPEFGQCLSYGDQRDLYSVYTETGGLYPFDGQPVISAFDSPDCQGVGWLANHVSDFCAIRGEENDFKSFKSFLVTPGWV